MTAAIEHVTTSALALALDVASARQQLIAANIANVNTVGHVPQRLDFAAEVESLRSGLKDGRPLSTDGLAAVRLQPRPVLDAGGRPVPVQLDTEMAELSRNTLQFQALTKALSRHLALLYTAASDGRK